MLYESRYYGACGLGDTVTHHGIKGQKWGIRRYQNPDGTLTEAGKKRYGTAENLQKSQEKSQRRTAMAQKAIIGTSFALSAMLISKHLNPVRSKSAAIDELENYFGSSVMNIGLNDLRKMRLNKSSKAEWEKMFDRKGRHSKAFDDNWRKMFDKYQNGLAD